MRSIKIILSVVVWVFVTVCPALGQNFIEDFKRINTLYKDSSYQMFLKYEYFNETTSTKADETLLGEVRKNRNMYYVKAHNTETIVNDKVFLQVSHDLKAMILDSSRSSYYSAMGINLDSLKRFYKNVEFTDVDSVSGEYKIPSISKGIAYTKIRFNKRNFQIDRIEIQFLDLRSSSNDGALRNKLVISYQEVNFTPKFNANSFSTKTFLYVKNGNFYPTKKYTQYNLVNNLRSQ